jgi:hypothetical protein
VALEIDSRGIDGMVVGIILREITDMGVWKRVAMIGTDGAKNGIWCYNNIGIERSSEARW